MQKQNIILQGVNVQLGRLRNSWVGGTDYKVSEHSQMKQKF